MSETHHSGIGLLDFPGVLSRLSPVSAAPRQRGRPLGPRLCSAGVLRRRWFVAASLLGGACFSLPGSRAKLAACRFVARLRWQACPTVVQAVVSGCLAVARQGRKSIGAPGILPRSVAFGGSLPRAEGPEGQATKTDRLPHAGGWFGRQSCLPRARSLGATHA